MVGRGEHRPERLPEDGGGNPSLLEVVVDSLHRVIRFVKRGLNRGVERVSIRAIGFILGIVDDRERSDCGSKEGGREGEGRVARDGWWGGGGRRGERRQQGAVEDRRRRLWRCMVVVYRAGRGFCRRNRRGERARGGEAETAAPSEAEAKHTSLLTESVERENKEEDVALIFLED